MKYIWLAIYFPVLIWSAVLPKDQLHGFWKCYQFAEYEALHLIHIKRIEH